MPSEIVPVAVAQAVVRIETGQASIPGAVVQVAERQRRSGKHHAKALRDPFLFFKLKLSEGLCPSFLPVRQKIHPGFRSEKAERDRTRRRSPGRRSQRDRTSQQPRSRCSGSRTPDIRACRQRLFLCINRHGCQSSLMRHICEEKMHHRQKTCARYTSIPQNLTAG